MLPKPLVAASLRPMMLALLSQRPMYGYEIIQRVRQLSDGQIRWTTSQLYPTLHGLENKGLVEAFWQASDAGPDRKYYRLTPQGERALERTRQDWLDLHRILDRLWGPQPAPSSA